MSFVEFHDVSKIYTMGENKIYAADKVNFTIEQGEFCVIVGPSGAGKTTVLNMLGGMDTVTEGKILVDGAEISSFNERQLTDYRRYDVGFVFQFYNLIQNLTAKENVEIASEICRKPLGAEETLRNVGLPSAWTISPPSSRAASSSASRSRAPIAKNPKLLLCDEPTGALDYETGKSILKLLQNVCRESGKTVIVITHNQRSRRWRTASSTSRTAEFSPKRCRRTLRTCPSSNGDGDLREVSA